MLVKRATTLTFFLAQVFVFCVLSHHAIALERIFIGNNGNEFQTQQGKFTPYGFNYLGTFGSLAEESWATESGWLTIKEDFDEMRELGANVIRWHLQFETFMDGPDKPNKASLLQLQKLLLLAEENKLNLNLTGLNCFRKERIPKWYSSMSEEGRWKVQAQFWSAISEVCANNPSVFCYDLINEPVIGKPFQGQDPWVLGELEGFHFVQRISHGSNNKDRIIVAEEWVETMVQAIRKHDKKSLVTVGIIPWAFVWPNAKPVFYSRKSLRYLDFVSIHVYPETGKLEREMQALQTYKLGKPLVIEEIFPMKCSLDEFDQFIKASSQHVDGWFSHYFGFTIEEHQNGAKPTTLVAPFLEYWSTQAQSFNRSPSRPTQD